MPVNSNAFPQDRVAQGLAVETKHKRIAGGAVRFLPRYIVLLGQGSESETFSLEPFNVSGGADEVAAVFGRGCPLHMGAKALFPLLSAGVGSIPVMVVPVASGLTASTGTVTALGVVASAGALRAVIAGIPCQWFPVDVADPDTLRATNLANSINATPDAPVTAAAVDEVVTLSAKWNGEDGDDIHLALEGSVGTGASWAIAAMSGGAGTPDPTSSLHGIGDDYATCVVSCFGPSASEVVDKVELHGEGRWDGEVAKPYIFVYASTEKVRPTLEAIGDAERANRICSLISVPDSPDFPGFIAAAAAVVIETTAQENPAKNYIRKPLVGVTPGSRLFQWDSTDRDFLAKAGVSTTELRNGQVTMSDTVTHYHPENDPDPAYRKVSTITRLQTVAYNVSLIFDADDWAGAPLVPDDQPVEEPSAKQPKMGKSELFGLADSLAAQAIISNPDYSKENCDVGISSTNGDRLNIVFPIYVSGNSDVRAATIYFSKYYGS